MKKAALLISLCVLTLSASAQNTALKVQSDGNIAIRTNSTALSPISINSAGSSSYYMYCNTGQKSGLYLKTTESSSNTRCGGNFIVDKQGPRNIGLKCYVDCGNANIGVMGSAVSETKAIGVLGNIDDEYCDYGAGVYGSTEYDYGSALTSGIYAGFFHGNVRVTGNILTGTTLQGALLGEASSSSGNGLSLRSTSVANSLSGLNVTTYQKERPENPKITEPIDDDIKGDTLKRRKEPKPDIMDEQFYDKTHYALDADRLEEIFPDLVYVNKDGSKVINYVEMIPLLVQSINELSAKIEVLEGQTSEGTAKKTRSATDKKASHLSQNKLFQNKPNPFKDQTVIRFSLADDVQNAAICIFDMTGKTIKKIPISSGMESVSVGGYELGEGMFLYSLVVNGQEIDTKKMIISK